MTTFYLIRHGEPDWDLKNARKLQGPMRDYVPLTQRGIAQAEEAGASHQQLFSVCDLIVSSPFTRSLQTAAILNRRLGLPLQVEFDLHEWVPDSFQKESYEDIQALHRDFYKNDGIYPQGETRLWETKQSVLDRTKAVLERYLTYENVIVVCHGMVIAILKGYGPGQVDLCSVHEYTIEGR
ncbi:histidine phosphatase family protein [Paenibacillus turpanensis]|uniref:histidine phosphatase family protein n=1 Tax=Paenibacillus turpanensis TaxID=2689078 RepID=UPI001407B4B5|nr:histidine phosphatase family protein [Paenibacillus turpanensis]